MERKVQRARRILHAIIAATATLTKQPTKAPRPLCSKRTAAARAQRCSSHALPLPSELSPPERGGRWWIARRRLLRLPTNWRHLWWCGRSSSGGAPKGRHVTPTEAPWEQQLSGCPPEQASPSPGSGLAWDLRRTKWRPSMILTPPHPPVTPTTHGWDGFGNRWGVLCSPSGGEVEQYELRNWQTCTNENVWDYSKSDI